MATGLPMDISAGEGRFTIPLDSQWHNNQNNELTDQQHNPVDSYMGLISKDFAKSNNIGKACKRSNIGNSEKNPTSVARRNARERRRIKNVNSAFDELRQHVPNGERNRKKISKVDTLQSAIEYIKALEELVRSRNKDNNMNRIDSTEADKENVPRINELPIEAGKATGRVRSESSSSNLTGSESDDVIFIGSVANAGQVEQLCDTESEHRGRGIDFEAAALTAKKGDRNTKQSSPVVLTESMLKAFDVMLEKCGSKKAQKEPVVLEHHSNLNEEENLTKLDMNNNNLAMLPSNVNKTQYDMQSQSSDSGFSEIFNENRDLEAIDQNNVIPLPRQRQSSFQLCFDALTENPPDLEIAASPILADQPNHHGQNYQCNELSLSSLQVQSPLNEPTFTELSPQITNFNQAVQQPYTPPLQPYADQQPELYNPESLANNMQNPVVNPTGNFFNFAPTFIEKAAHFDNIFSHNALPTWIQANPELTNLEQINPTFNALPAFGSSFEPVFTKQATTFSTNELWNGGL